MYIRFVIHHKDEDSGKLMGIFQALVEAREDGLLYEYELNRVKEIHKWFSEHLDRPTSFKRSSKPHTINKAISWFKDNAIEHISLMRELASMLDGHGIMVDIIQTDRVGYVVYEDEFQITAEPFSDTVA